MGWCLAAPVAALVLDREGAMLREGAVSASDFSLFTVFLRAFVANSRHF